MDLGAWRFLATTRVLPSGSGRVAITPREAQLLRYLLVRPGRIVSAAELLREVWKQPPRSRSRAVAHCVSRLRRKLGPDGARIANVYGRGYVLNVEDDHPLEGRSALIERVNVALILDRWVTLHGVVGIGKTAIARVVQASFASAWWVDAARFRTAGELCAGVARATGLAHGAGAPVGFLRSLDGTHTLLVLDGADQLAHEGMVRARSWLEEAANLTVLITARRRGRFEPQLRVPPLDDADATRLLVRLCGRGSGEAPPLPAQLLGGIPLALHMAAKRLQLMAPEELRAHLARGVEILGTGPRSLHAGLVSAWRTLPPSGRRVLRVAATLGEPFAITQLRTKVRQPMAAVVSTLDELLTCGWVEAAPPIFWMLEPVRRFVHTR